MKMADASKNLNRSSVQSRRSFVSFTTATAALVTLRESAYAATPQILSTSGLGIKYAVTKDVPEGSAKRRPQRGDIVAIEYTGYLSDGTAFDREHNGKGDNKIMMMKLGDKNVMLEAVQDVVSEMYVGQKVQAIIPPALGFGDKGLCAQEDGMDYCVVPPKSTLVYDIYLKRATIPPP